MRHFIYQGMWYTFYNIRCLIGLDSLVAQMVKNPSATWETWVRILGQEGHPTPGLLPRESHRQEPGGLQSMASQRVGHSWATNTLDLIVKVIKNCVAGLSCFSGFVYSFISWLRWVLLLCAGFSSCGVRLLTAAASLVPRHGLGGWRAPWLWLLGSRARAHCLVARGVFLDLGSNASALHWQVGS